MSSAPIGENSVMSAIVITLPFLHSLHQSGCTYCIESCEDGATSQNVLLRLSENSRLPNRGPVLVVLCCQSPRSRGHRATFQTVSPGHSVNRSNTLPAHRKILSNRAFWPLPSPPLPDTFLLLL